MLEYCLTLANVQPVLSLPTSHPFSHLTTGRSSDLHSLSVESHQLYTFISFVRNHRKFPALPKLHLLGNSSCSPSLKPVSCSTHWHLGRTLCLTDLATMSSYSDLVNRDALLGLNNHPGAAAAGVTGRASLAFLGHPSDHEARETLQHALAILNNHQLLMHYATQTKQVCG